MAQRVEFERRVRERLDAVLAAHRDRFMATHRHLVEMSAGGGNNSSNSGGGFGGSAGSENGLGQGSGGTSGSVFITSASGNEGGGGGLDDTADARVRAESQARVWLDAGLRARTQQ